MPDYETRIKTKVGEFTVHFNDKSDLETKLAQIPEFTSIIESKLGTILVKETAKVMEEFADLYTMGPEGIIKLLKYPKKDVDSLRLALFLSPKSLTPAQLKQATGVEKPTDYMTKGFVANADGTYSIDPDARAKVANKIIPSLRGEKKAK
jgi:hypothetical protein